MKKIKHIIFLSSLMMVSFACAMENELTIHGQWFIRLDSKAQAVIKYGVGSDVCYYGRHRAERQDDNSLLFPVEFTDPLPIEYRGDKRYFITIGSKGDRGSPKQACEIVGSTSKQLAVVRGIIKKDQQLDCTEKKRVVNIYLGLDTDNVELIGDKGRKRIYPARVLLLQKRD